MIKQITRSDGMHYSVRSNRERIFLPSEWINFFNCLKTKQKLTFLVLINTGARINEARHIKVKDINFNDKTITLKVVKRRSGYANGKIRTIPISNKLTKFLKEYIKLKNFNEDDYLGLLSTPGANIAMKNALRKANINDWYMFSIHNIRKTLECWLLALNVDYMKLLVHFGHNQSTALKHYLLPDILKENEKNKINQIIGNLYYCNGDIDKLYSKIRELENKLNCYQR